MIAFDRPLYDGASAELSGGLFLLWEGLPNGHSLQNALLASVIRQQIESLPSVGVFDWVDFHLEGETAVLTGWALNPEVPGEAIRSLSNLAVLDQVANLIEVLPVSLSDDMIRAEAYSLLYADQQLSGYCRHSAQAPTSWVEPPTERGHAAYHPMRIIVSDGRLVLAGQVGSRAEADRASRMAERVHGVVNVENRLKVSGNWN